MTSISDVARAAGVSPATVSRVLNGSGQVSAERAERVRQAADELGYQPFGPARALRRQRTTVWAAIVADIENPFFTALIRGGTNAATGASLLDGVVLAGWRTGAAVHVEFETLPGCSPTGGTCFEGTIHVGRAPKGND